MLAPEPDLSLEGVREPIYRRGESMDEEHARQSFDVMMNHKKILTIN